MKGFPQKVFLEIKVPEDSGNAELVKVDQNKIYLKIRSDTNSLVFHWFYFQLKAKESVFTHTTQKATPTTVWQDKSCLIS